MRPTQSSISPHERLALSVVEACQALGIGRTSLYALISAGQLEARKVGRRTIISAESLRSLLTRLPSSSGGA
jgi:excisionase family DNA binding protein